MFEQLLEGIFPKNLVILSEGTQFYSVIFLSEEDPLYDPYPWDTTIGTISSGGFFTAPTTLTSVTGVISYNDTVHNYSTYVTVVPLTGAASSGASLVVPDIEPTLVVDKINVFWDILDIPSSTGMILLRPLGNTSYSSTYVEGYSTLSLNANTYFIRGLLSLSSGVDYLTSEHEFTINKESDYRVLPPLHTLYQ